MKFRYQSISYLVITFLLAVLLIACNKDKIKDSDGGFNPNKPSFRKGTKWTYTFKSYDQNNVLVNQLDSDDEIVRDTMINGSKYFVTAQAIHFTFKANGRYEIDRYSNEEILIFKYPFFNHESYTIERNTQLCVPRYIVSALNNDSSYTTSYGKVYKNLSYYSFYSHTMNCQGFQGVNEYFYDPKMGLFIYLKFYNIGFKEYSTFELKSFTY